MNDQNAFLQGQGSPIKDNEPPPTQGWRGEKAADESPAGDQQRRPLPGTDAQVELVSGTAFVDSRGPDVGRGQPAVDQTVPPPTPNVSKASRPDGVSNLHMGADSPGGESAGAPYPNHYDENTPKDRDGFLGHGGQTGMAYHGTGHLGEKKVGDDDNRNGVAQSDD
ncbi:hypothetical protein WG907_11260 [Sphingobium sp. AN558]|uniref:hypothetical protein n=1 Tax=Sphingobium sp. AN558 TaxID=3133442 RepID=UPI0030C3FDE0